MDFRNRNISQQKVGDLNIKTPYKSKQKKLFQDLLIPTRTYFPDFATN